MWNKGLHQVTRGGVIGYFALFKSSQTNYIKMCELVWILCIGQGCYTGYIKARIENLMHQNQATVDEEDWIGTNKTINHHQS